MQTNHDDLTGLRILVTRPLHQTQHLCDLICRAGGNPIVFPTLAIAEIADKKPLIDIIKNLDHMDVALFTSANSVLQTATLIQQAWPHLPAKLQFAAIGKATAQTLAKFNLPISIYPEKEFNSEALLAVNALQNIRNKRIVIFRGDEGRELLTKTLKKRGAVVTEAFAYKRTQPQTESLLLLKALQAGAIDIMISTSQNSLHNLLNMLGTAGHKDLMNTPLLVISQRIAQLAKQTGFNTVIVTENASDAALLSALKCEGKNSCKKLQIKD